MSFAQKHNRGNLFEIDTKEFRYLKFADLAQQGANVIHRLDGFYIVTGKIGTQPVFIDKENKLLVNAPAHLTEQMKTILADPESVADIKRGIVGYTLREYESHGKKCYTVNWVDLPEPDNTYK